MISKILIIADASLEALELVLDAFQTIRKHQPKVRGIFVSCLSKTFLKKSSPNLLSLLLKEEKEAIESAESYFERMNIPHHIEVITVPPYQIILDEMKMWDYDLIVLQGEFLNICRKNSLNWGSYFREVFRLNCPFWQLMNRRISFYQSVISTQKLHKRRNSIGRIKAISFITPSNS